ncbi:DNase I-like protein [Annulohypoxylon bovei var. microspora]|nr:DNase I-like protein [Annulohypoxylon bovei var. microspora]
MAGVDCLPIEVNILTLNCWGIPYVSQDRSSRLEEIGRHIVKAKPQPHIVGLQECFSRKDFERIQQETCSILPYFKQYFAGPLGAGLVLLSRWPIEETSMTRYPLNGSPTAFSHSDWYAGKGIAYARVRYGKEPDNVIDVFNTHMHAFYPGNEYICHRASQAWELSKLLRAASRRRHGRALVVLLGDLNAEPTSLPYRILKHFVPDLHDTWPQHKKNPGNNREIGDVQREHADIQNGVTYGSPYNTWMWTRGQRARYLGQPATPTSELVLPAEVGQEQAVRIDYVLASVAPLRLDPSTDEIGGGKDVGNTRSSNHGCGVWVVKAAKVGMTDRHPVLGCSLSDHFSVETTLMFQPVERGVSESQKLIDEPSGSGPDIFTRPKSATSSKAPIQEVHGASISGELLGETGTIGLLDEILHVLDDYNKVLRQRAWWRVRLGVASTVLVGSLAGVWVVNGPGWARLVLSLSGALASAFVALDTWGGLSLRPTEMAALAEFEWEVGNAKRGRDGGTDLS